MSKHHLCSPAASLASSAVDRTQHVPWRTLPDAGASVSARSFGGCSIGRASDVLAGHSRGSDGLRGGGRHDGRPRPRTGNGRFRAGRPDDRLRAQPVQDADPGTAPPTTTAPLASGPRAGDGASNATGRFNVAAAHSPELLRLLAAATGTAAESAPSGEGRPRRRRDWHRTQRSSARRRRERRLVTKRLPARRLPARGPRHGAPRRDGAGRDGLGRNGSRRDGLGLERVPADGLGRGWIGRNGSRRDWIGRNGLGWLGRRSRRDGIGSQRDGIRSRRTPDQAPAERVQTGGLRPRAWTSRRPSTRAAPPSTGRRSRRPGYAFAAIKSTEGDYYANPHSAADLASAKAAGLYVTAYHFAIPNVSGGAAQADFALSHGRLRGRRPGRAARAGHRVRPVHPHRPHQRVLRTVPGADGVVDRRVRGRGATANRAAPGHLHHALLVGRLHGRQQRLRRRSALGRRTGGSGRAGEAGVTGWVGGLGVLAVHQRRDRARHRFGREHRRERGQRRPAPRCSLPVCGPAPRAPRHRRLPPELQADGRARASWGLAAGRSALWPGLARP